MGSFGVQQTASFLLFDQLSFLLRNLITTEIKTLSKLPVHCTQSSFVTVASMDCSKVPPWDGGTQVSGSQADWFSKVTGLFSQPWVTQSSLLAFLFIYFFFLPVLGFSYSKANNFRLSVAKRGRKGVLQIQKVNPTCSFLN